MIVLKIASLFLALVLAMNVSSQPLETIATSGGATLSTQLLNWAQVGFEAFLAWAQRGFGHNMEEEKTTSEYFFKLELKLLALLPIFAFSLVLDLQFVNFA